jgi:hypothetical protein
MMLGKVQFELQKFVDTYVSSFCCYVGFCMEMLEKSYFFNCSYCIKICDPDMLALVIQRSNIIHTITTPSESLLKELQTVEVRSMKFTFRFVQLCILIQSADTSCLLPTI